MKRSVFNIIFRLFKLIDKFIAMVVLATLNGSLGILCAISITSLSSLALMKLTPLSPQIDISFNVLLILIVSLGILRGFLRYFEQYLNHHIAFKILAIIRHKVFASLRNLSIADLEEKEKGNMFSVISSDIETLEVFYAHTVSPASIYLLINSVVITILSVFVSYYIGLLTLFSYIFIGIILPSLNYRNMKNNGSNYRKTLADFNSFFLDSAKGINQTRLYQDQDRVIKKIYQDSALLDKEKNKINNKSALFRSFAEFSIIMNVLLSLLVFYFLYQSHQVNLVQIVFGITLIFSSYGPALALSALPMNLVQTFSSGNRVLDVIDQKPSLEPITGEKNLSHFEDLTIQKLSFSYDNHKVIDNLNLEIKKNEIAVIKGKSGIGKSTLLKLILRYYKRDSGQIQINGIDLEKINHDSLLDVVTMFSQSTYLFHMTIRDNLKLGNLNASDEEIYQALEKAGCMDIIEKQRDGLDTVINDRQNNISVGEKQRLGLARVLMKKPSLLLLDEPTSNIDAENEQIFLQTLQSIQNEMAIIIVTHKEAPVAIADKVYSFENGGFIKC